MSLSIEELRELCAKGSVRWTDHVLKRLMQRGIFQSEIIQAIMDGEIIEQYPDDYPYPSCLILGTTGRIIHVACGRGENELWIITAYRPDSSEWEDDFKTRKQV